jgi:hypothetical protein
MRARVALARFLIGAPHQATKQPRSQERALVGPLRCIGLMGCCTGSGGRPSDGRHAIIFAFGSAFRRRVWALAVHLLNDQGDFVMPRATWRGFLRLSLVTCPVYLSPATHSVCARE